MIKTVFLDMDGVITSFRRGICSALDKPYDYLTMSDKWVFWDDWPNVTFKMVNDVCTTTFWDSLPWMHDGHDILTAVEYKFTPVQIYLLTTPMPNLESASGKMMWIKSNLPVYLKRTIITQAPKSLLARRDTLLIDDKDENIVEFEAAGGRGILVPRPYNLLHTLSDKSSQHVRHCLEELI